MTLDEIKTLYDSLCTPMDSYLGAVEQVQARHVLASKAFPFLIQIASAARDDINARLGPGRDLTKEVQTLSAIQHALHALEEAKL